MQIAVPSSSAQQFQSPAGLAANAQTAGAGTSSSASAQSANAGTSTAAITANDFLQLLVTELQNQDPTANTDPNEYVNQLVQVNTLQQQIQMNQTLDGGPTLTGASSGVLQELAQMNQALEGDLSPAAPPAEMSRNPTPASLQSGSGGVVSAGNLSATANSGNSVAAEAVATALARSPHGAGAGPQASAFERFAADLRGKAN